MKKAGHRFGSPPLDNLRGVGFSCEAPVYRALPLPPWAFLARSAMAARRLSFTRSCSSTAITLTSIGSPTLQTSATLETYSFGQFADVAQSVLAGQDLDERAEVLHAGHPAVVDASDLDGGGERFDLGEGLLGGFGDGRRNGDRAVVLDVDRRPGALLDRADRLSARADQQPDLVRIDVRPQQPRRPVGNLGLADARWW